MQYQIYQAQPLGDGNRKFPSLSLRNALFMITELKVMQPVTITCLSSFLIKLSVIRVISELRTPFQMKVPV